MPCLDKKETYITKSESSWYCHPFFYLTICHVRTHSWINKVCINFLCSFTFLEFRSLLKIFVFFYHRFEKLRTCARIVNEVEIYKFVYNMFASFTTYLKSFGSVQVSSWIRVESVSYFYRIFLWLPNTMLYVTQSWPIEAHTHTHPSYAVEPLPEAPGLSSRAEATDQNPAEITQKQCSVPSPTTPPPHFSPKHNNRQSFSHACYRLAREDCHISRHIILILYPFG